jgi:hypothetical protein
VRAVLQRFRPEGLPLYLRLAFEQVRRWRSTDPLDLAPTVPGVVGSLFDRLAQRSAHGALVVARCLGTLACARHGVAEDEMAALLGGDAALQRDFRRRSPQSPPTPALPPIVWSRLLFDLQAYLATRPGDGTLLLGFEHREFESLARQRFAHGAAAKATRRALAAYFGWPPAHHADGAATDRRRLSELPFQLAQDGRWGALTRLLLDISFLEAKVGATGPQSLVDELALVPGVGAGGARTSRQKAALAGLRDAVRLGASVLQMAPHELAAHRGRPPVRAGGGQPDRDPPPARRRG